MSNLILELKKLNDVRQVLIFRRTQLPLLKLPSDSPELTARYDAQIKRCDESIDELNQQILSLTKQDYYG